MPNPLYMGLTNEGLVVSDFLKWEEEHGYSREKGTIVGAKEFFPGQVVEGVITTSCIAWAGTNAITGIVANYIKVAAGETAYVSLIVRDAIVDKRGLNWGTGTEAAGLPKIATDLPRILIRQIG